MEFGRVDASQIDQVDFSLPPDTSLTKSVLNSARVNNPEFYIGCAKWGRKEWVGMIYPEKTKDANFLDEYVKHFNSIELNATFYKIPEREMIAKWKEKAAKEKTDFKFCPKFSKPISHFKRLVNAEDQTSAFLSGIHEFGNYLGPSFLQLGDNFGPKNMDVLHDYLKSLPLDLNVFVEVRHKDWFADATARKDLFALLHQLNKGAVITDASGRRDCVHMEMPTPHAFIRFVGNGLHPTDYKRIDDWIKRLKIWLDNGLQSVYFFLHQHDEKDTPVLGEYSVNEFNKHLGSALAGPKFIAKNQSLFD